MQQNRRLYQFKGKLLIFFGLVLCLITTLVQFIPKIHYSYHPTWSPVDSKIAFVCYHLSSIQTYGLERPPYSGDIPYSPLHQEICVSDGKSIRIVTNNNFSDYYPRWSPDGAWLAFFPSRASNPALYLMRPDGSEERELVQATYGSDIAWSPDGKTIALATSWGGVRNDPSGIFLIDLQSGTQKQVWAGEVMGLAWSPDEEWIAFTARTDYHACNLYILSISNQSEAIGPITAGCNSPPSWSADGNYLAFVMETISQQTESGIGPRQRTLFLLNSMTLDKQQLTSGSEWIEDIIWSPTEPFLFYIEGKRIMGLDLQNMVQPEEIFTSDSLVVFYGGGNLTISPDGQTLAFLLGGKGKSEVWLKDMNSSQLTRLRSQCFLFC
jgi:Tol biopolymer transport system component